MDKYEDKARERLIEIIDQLCKELDVDPWELDCFKKHECERD
jgi:hypothetical protein